MGKIYNVILESNVGTGAGNYGRTYYIDWSILPQGAYKVSFNFNSAVVITVNNIIANIFCDLGQGQNTIIANGQTGSVYRQNYLGTLYWTGTGANNALYAHITSNPPIYLTQRPMNNTVFIEIHTNSAPFETNYAAPDVGQYTMVLSFELIN